MNEEEAAAENYRYAPYGDYGSFLAAVPPHCQRKRAWSAGRRHARAHPRYPVCGGWKAVGIGQEQ